MRFKARVGVLLAACAMAAGCGSDELELHPVTGVVTYKGAAVPGATVTFSSETAPLAIGVTDDQGAFELNTLGRPGAASGTYGVSVIAMKDSREITPEEAQSIKTEELNKIRKSLIPAKYGHPRTSGLTHTVSDDDSSSPVKLELAD